VRKYHRGYLKQVWEKDAGERNEALDLEVYCYAAAIYAGLMRINWDRLEAALRMTAQDLFVQAEQAATPEGRAARDAAEAEAARLKRERAEAQRDERAAVQTSAPVRKNWMPRRNDWLRR
jgi:phage terminase large subunit GpA-like protein